MSRPVVRNALNNAWLDVFCKGGWQMKLPDGTYLKLDAYNTKFRDATNTNWIEFYCPIPPPNSVTGGIVRSNRLLDSNGYLWACGYAPGAFEDGTSYSTTWQKTKFSAKVGAEYLSEIKYMDCGADTEGTNPSLVFITKTNKIYFAGDNFYGIRGVGVVNAYSASVAGAIDYTSNFETYSKQTVANIAQISVEGWLLTADGVPLVDGLLAFNYISTDAKVSNTYEVGIMGIALGSQTANNLTTGNRALVQATWKQLNYSSDGKTATSNSLLTGIKCIAKNVQRQTFALGANGVLYQCPYWYNKTAYNVAVGNPFSANRYDSMIPMGIPFTESTPVFLHPGAILQAANSNLYYAVKSLRLSSGQDPFYDFQWVNSGIALNAFGGTVKRIVGYIDAPKDQDTPTVTIFILFEDGRLYGAGNNAAGWFGVGSAVKTVTVNSPMLLNSNVLDFDIDMKACILLKKDGTMFGSGSNVGARLGIGAANTAATYYDWQQCVFTSI